MALDLSKVGERERLKPRAEPYWQRLRGGCFLGFRPSKRGGKGTWIARAYDEDAGKYRVKSLGDFGTLAGKDIFAAAKREAERLAELVEAGGEIRAKVETVADACRTYAETRPEAEARFKRYVYDDPLGKVKLDKLRRRHVAEWRKRLEENGKAWDKNSWKLPIRAAVKAAGLPDGVTAYTLRHSTITDLVNDGLALLTIAQISGTSAEMIERHYGHLVSDAATKALSSLEL